MNATAEDRPGGPAKEPSDAYRESVRSLFSELAKAAGAVDPEHLAGQLALLYDGATVAARMDENPGVGATAREIAVTLVDAATGPGAAGIDHAKRVRTTPGRGVRGGDARGPACVSGVRQGAARGVGAAAEP